MPTHGSLREEYAESRDDGDTLMLTTLLMLALCAPPAQVMQLSDAVEAIESDSVSDQLEALEAFRRRRDSDHDLPLERVLELARDSEVALVRSNAYWTLCEHPESAEAAIPVLIEGLADEEASRAAAHALSSVGGASREALEAVLDDPDVGDLAAGALLQMGDAGIPALQRRAASPEGWEQLARVTSEGTWKCLPFLLECAVEPGQSTVGLRGIRGAGWFAVSEHLGLGWSAGPDELEPLIKSLGRSARRAGPDVRRAFQLALAGEQQDASGLADKAVEARNY